MKLTVRKRALVAPKHSIPLRSLRAGSSMGTQASSPPCPRTWQRTGGAGWASLGVARAYGRPEEPPPACRGPRKNSKYPPAKPGALVVSRSKRQDVAATRHLSHPMGGCSHPTGAALAVGLPAPAPGYTRESLAHPDPAWTRSSLEPRSADRQNCATARQTPERCRSRSCP